MWRDAPMKPVEAWALVSKETGEVNAVLVKQTEGYANRSLLKGERLVRVVITEKEDNHAE